MADTGTGLTVNLQQKCSIKISRRPNCIQHNAREFMLGLKQVVCFPSIKVYAKLHKGRKALHEIPTAIKETVIGLRTLSNKKQNKTQKAQSKV